MAGSHSRSLCMRAWACEGAGGMVAHGSHGPEPSQAIRTRGQVLRAARDSRFRPRRAHNSSMRTRSE